MKKEGPTFIKGSWTCLLCKYLKPNAEHYGFICDKNYYLSHRDDTNIFNDNYKGDKEIYPCPYLRDSKIELILKK